MAAQFIGEKIEVETGGRAIEPVSMSWRGARYHITEIVTTWHDWGFPSGAKQRDWRTRRHRNYFRVRTDAGDIFEIYLDRSRGPGEWFLYQRLGDEAAS
ncbi:MAG: DUF6504 family protein [Candidatus Zixiibacteriota bacterium]